MVSTALELRRWFKTLSVFPYTIENMIFDHILFYDVWLCEKCT